MSTSSAHTVWSVQSCQKWRSKFCSRFCSVAPKMKSTERQLISNILGVLTVLQLFYFCEDRGQPFFLQKVKVMFLQKVNLVSQCFGDAIFCCQFDVKYHVISAKAETCYGYLRVGIKYNKLVKLRKHASRVYLANIHFGIIHFGIILKFSQNSNFGKNSEIWPIFLNLSEILKFG